MTVVNEIRESFASMFRNGAMKIHSLPDEYPAYVIRIQDGYGVAIPIDANIEIAESFNSCRYRTGILSINGVSSNYLMLISYFYEYRYEFASICAQMIDPGEDGLDRKLITRDPLKWWSRMRELVGNEMKNKEVYSIIAEMCVLEHAFLNDPSAEWAASHAGSHDIECDSMSCEVKSTNKKYGATVAIAGQHQLTFEKPLYLYFVRMEESKEGISINDMVAHLTGIGYDSKKLEIELQRQGLERAASIRDKQYKILEKRKYLVDESFPRITNESFAGNRIPAGITKIEYTVDLDSLEYTSW